MILEDAYVIQSTTNETVFVGVCCHSDHCLAEAQLFNQTEAKEFIRVTKIKNHKIVRALDALFKLYVH